MALVLFLGGGGGGGTEYRLVPFGTILADFLSKFNWMRPSASPQKVKIRQSGSPPILTPRLRDEFGADTVREG